jgi:hypothetical protein
MENTHLSKIFFAVSKIRVPIPCEVIKACPDGIL